MKRAAAAAILVVALAGCRDRFVFVCSDNSQCVRGGVSGQCLVAPDQKRYCAFSDGKCLHWDDTAAAPFNNMCVGGDDMGAPGGDGDGGLDLSVSGTTFDLSGEDLAFNADAGFITAGCSTTADLYGVWGDSADEIWVVGKNSTIFHYRTGMACQPQSAGMTGLWLRSVWGRNANDVYIVGDGVILHSTNHGASWTASTNVNSGDSLWSVGGTTAKTFAALETSPFGVYTSDASGASWTLVGGFSGGSPIDAVWGTSTDAWIAGSGYMYHWTDSSMMWSPNLISTQLSAQIPGYISAISGFAPTTVIFTSEGGAIFRATDGATFNKVYDANVGNAACAVSGGFRSVWATAARVLAVGAEGCIALSTDQGQNWKAYDFSHGTPNSFTDQQLNGVWIDPSGALAVVVGNMGVVRANPPMPQ